MDFRLLLQQTEGKLGGHLGGHNGGEQGSGYMLQGCWGGQLWVKEPGQIMGHPQRVHKGPHGGGQGGRQMGLGGQGPHCGDGKGQGPHLVHGEGPGGHLGGH